MDLGQFSEDEARKIMRLTSIGVRHAHIADIVNASMDAVRQFCNRNGIRLCDGDVMPAGHNFSWGAITHGTTINGTPFNRLNQNLEQIPIPNG